MLALEIAEQERDEVCAGARGRADGKRSGQAPVVRAELVEELFLEREHALGAPVQTPAGLGVTGLLRLVVGCLVGLAPAPSAATVS